MPEVTSVAGETSTVSGKPLKSTLNLPETAFPMKANLPQNEPARLAGWTAQDLYGQIRTARAGSPKYILHDGPPYANGAIHLGHALNKCIKDFVVKTKTMAGFDAPYVPGWDCHGRRAAWPQEAGDASRQRPPRLPRVRPEVRRPAERAVSAHRRLRAMERSV
jgi:isoleucyl-tRNA synthetase